MIFQGDCLEILPTLEADSVDSIVTDPPYGLSFMGKDWDHGIPGVPYWQAVLRVAKPGAYLLAFGGTRTHHRLTCAIEDAGWEIRDSIGWIYGSGFPKSHNGPWGGTALKPAWEPIIMARKPINGTVAANVLKYGTGGLNIDGCRVAVNPTIDDMLRKVDRGVRDSETWKYGSGFRNETNYLTGVPASGRWPANLIHDGSEEVVGLFPTTGPSNMRPPTGKPLFAPKGRAVEWNANSVMDTTTRGIEDNGGSAARFFYCAKASRQDRNEGLDGLEKKSAPNPNFGSGGFSRPTGDPERETSKSQNNHPTVKPTDLMRYLCRLITPLNGVILDPFMGSGSTGKAAGLEGFDFIGIELNPDYCQIAERRIEAAELPLFKVG